MVLKKMVVLILIHFPIVEIASDNDKCLESGIIAY